MKQERGKISFYGCPGDVVLHYEQGYNRPWVEVIIGGRAISVAWGKDTLEVWLEKSPKQRISDAIEIEREATYV